MDFQHSPEKPSQLDNIIPPEIINDPFYTTIIEMAREKKIKHVLEIGSSSGEGSTEAFVKGLSANSNSPFLYCLEISKPRYRKLKSNYQKYPFVKCYNFSSVNPNKFMTQSVVETFYHQNHTSLNDYPLDMVLGWLKQDLDYIGKERIPKEGIRLIKTLNNIRYFDMVLIDGSAFTAIAELKEVYGAKYILLDDVSDIKNYNNYIDLSSDPNYRLVKEDLAVRNGFAVFEKIIEKPEKYENISREVESIPGKLVKGQEEYFFNKVSSLDDNAVIIEIGADKGRSTAAMAYACLGAHKRIFSFFSEKENENGIYSDWQKYITARKLNHHVIPIVGNIIDNLARFKEITGVDGVDFVFIDAPEPYENVLDYFLNTFPLIKDYGWFAIHDVVDSWPGPNKLWMDVASGILKNHEITTTLACGQKLSLDKKALPIHFFTIVLNGEPFIRYHIDVLKQLDFEWKWHIVEGVAAHTHDTNWCEKRGGKITDALHINGLSNDGTKEYLDQLMAAYPDNVIVYRKENGEFWDGKLEMVNAPIVNINEDCLLWQIDADELWTLDQIYKARKMFAESPEKTAAYYFCHFFVGENLLITTRNTYGNYTSYEWLRTFHFKPGYKWISHEPPTLSKQTHEGKWVNIAALNPFMHKKTKQNGLIFQHFAYVTKKQIQFKENYYGYRNISRKWEDMQNKTDFPLKLKDYFDWSDDGAMVNKPASLGVVPLSYKNTEGAWAFTHPKPLPKIPDTNEIFRNDPTVITPSKTVGVPVPEPMKNRGRKNILVVSHERAGTHFLINSIAFNFPQYDNQELSVLGAPTELKKIFSLYYSKEERHIFKSHHQFYYFLPFLSELLKHYHIFYIRRDGRDVLTSCFHYFNKSGSESFPVTDSMDDFLSIKPYEYPFDKEYSLLKTSNMIERWCVHVKGWELVQDRITILDYEKMVEDFDETIETISKVLGLPAPKEKIIPKKSDRTVFARKGVVGDWKNIFSDKALKRFYEITTSSMKKKTSSN